MLIVHGSKDVITNPEDSLKFYRKISSKDKSYKIFEEGYHQLHEDNEMNNLQKCIYQWCKPRALKSKAFSKEIKSNFSLKFYFRWSQKSRFWNPEKKIFEEKICFYSNIFAF